MTTADQSFVPQSAPTASKSNGLWEWVWRGDALRAAQARAKLSYLGRERLRRARVAAEFADRALDPIEPLRAGSPLPLAISLYREAVYWALIQHNDAPAVASLREAFAAAPHDLAQLAGSEDKLAAVRTALLDRTFVETAEAAPEQLRREAELSQSFAYALIDSIVDREDRVASVLVQRWLRLVGFCIVAIAALTSAGMGISRATRGADVVLGKPWRASSQQYECHPKNVECGGARSAMFFHTTEESQPWVDFDLGSPQTMGRIQVVNREDCCPERAIPLVVEVSDDRTKWRTVARTAETFREWETTFPAVTARYLRLRVDRRTSFHLVRVSAFAR